LEEFKTKHGKNIKDTSVNPEISNLINFCINNKKSVSYESYFKPENQPEIWLQTTLSPIINSDGTLKKLIAVESDISIIKKAEEEIITQKEELEYKNRQINSSINYAKTIQTAMLPSDEDNNKFFDYFVIYRPKDIVSGDFYQIYPFINEKGLRCFFAAVVDCTGHGVPGAFMSMIGMRLLSEIINERKVQSPAEILRKINEEIMKSLKQGHSANNDGMDASICKILPTADNRHEIVFSGAKSPLWIYRKKLHKIETIKGTRKSIGGMSGKNDETFTDNITQINSGDIVYMFSDGFRDQNNPERLRFGSEKLEKTLLEIVSYDLKTQKQKLEKALDEWQNGIPQRDDITFFAARF
jgi:serine phosphatase RsbU (regulator of sigma subunit)